MVIQKNEGDKKKKRFISHPITKEDEKIQVGQPQVCFDRQLNSSGTPKRLSQPQQSQSTTSKSLFVAPQQAQTPQATQTPSPAPTVLEHQLNDSHSATVPSNDTAPTPPIATPVITGLVPSAPVPVTSLPGPSSHKGTLGVTYKKLALPVQNIENLPGKKAKTSTIPKNTSNRCAVCRVLYDGKEDKELTKKYKIQNRWLGCDQKATDGSDCSYWGHARCIGVVIQKGETKNQTSKRHYLCPEHKA